MATKKKSRKSAKTDSNEHVRQFLREYISLKHSPHYAVLLKGPWGIGKTFLVKSFLKDYLSDKENYVYVSLYGLSSVAEIDAAMLRAIYPFLASKGVQVANRLAKTAAKFFGVDSDLTVSEFLTKFKTKLYVFDDLERCNMPINELMGYINEFVEHDGSKVLIIANDAEIADGPDGKLYARVREKLIGKTFEIQSAFNEALAHFLSLVDFADAAKILSANKEEVARIYHQSQLNNLRILQRTIWDFERVVKSLKLSQRRNGRAMTALLRLFFALSFEVKAGRITAAELMNRKNAYIAASMPNKDAATPTGFAEANKRYQQGELFDTVLSDNLLVEILEKGVIDQKALQLSLDRSSYIVNPATEAPWRVLWHWFEREEKDFNRAKDEVQKLLTAHEVLEPGELLHIFGLQLLFSEKGIVAETKPQIVANAKRYVDELLASEKLSPLNENNSEEFRFNGYGGLGIHENQSAEYREIADYLEVKRKEAAKKLYPQQAAKLLADMERDPEEFYRKLCLSDSNIGVYWGVPILSAIDPKHFVTTLLRQSAATQRTVFQTLNSRYERGSLHSDLKDELPWLASVRDELNAELGKLTPATQLRISRNIQWHVTKFVPSPK